MGLRTILMVAACCCGWLAMTADAACRLLANGTMVCDTAAPSQAYAGQPVMRVLTAPVRVVGQVFHNVGERRATRIEHRQARRDGRHASSSGSHGSAAASYGSSGGYSSAYAQPAAASYGSSGGYGASGGSSGGYSAYDAYDDDGYAIVPGSIRYVDSTANAKPAADEAEEADSTAKDDSAEESNESEARTTGAATTPPVSAGQKDDRDTHLGLCVPSTWPAHGARQSLLAVAVAPLGRSDGLAIASTPPAPRVILAQL